MNLRLVMPEWFRVRAAVVRWSDERERLRRWYEALGQPYIEPQLQEEEFYETLQLRWQLHTKRRLPPQPFTVWRAPRPVGNFSAQAWATGLDWELVETVGLPVDDAWADTGYDLSDQGLRAEPVDPIKAALRRLQVGATQFGWTAHVWAGGTVDDWDPTDRDAYLEDLNVSPLLDGIRDMLRTEPDPTKQAAFERHDNEDNLGERLALRATLDNVAMPSNETKHLVWSPLKLLAVSTGTDTLASLALGFGTAYKFEPDMLNTVYMVMTTIKLPELNITVELADVVIPEESSGPDVVQKLNATFKSHTRAQQTDHAGLDTIAVNWDRPPLPDFSPATLACYPVSYAIRRIRSDGNNDKLLLHRRVASDQRTELGGWMAYAASSSQGQRIEFADHVVRTMLSGGQIVLAPRALECEYAVAAQDLFGRWSPWVQTHFKGQDERPQIPAIMAVQLASNTGSATVDFAWDWSERSPEFIELLGAYEDDQGHPVFNIRLQFSGQDEPIPNDIRVTPLTQDRQPAAGWGRQQDRLLSPPGTRIYRLTIPVPVAFGAGQTWRIFQVQARGQCHVHQQYIAGWNISAYCPPARTQIDNPAPPPAPTITPLEAPEWASLPDRAGVSRAVLRWTQPPSDQMAVAGFALYEATETTLLAEIDPEAQLDLNQPFTDRLRTLRLANLPAARPAFRRVRKDLIAVAGVNNSFEVVLPRGSRVMHVYAITAVGVNQQESDFPAASDQFIAVAAPHLNVPRAPALEATIDTTANPPVVCLWVGVDTQAGVRLVEVFRTARADLKNAADKMGAPVQTLDVAGAEANASDALNPSWRQVWYRAVAWTLDDPLAGSIGARSPASSAVAVLLPPVTPPDLRNVRVYRTLTNGRDVLIAWASDVPTERTPLGWHTFMIVTDPDGAVPAQIERTVDQVVAISSPLELTAAAPTQPIYSDGATYYTFVQRPVADQPFSVRVKVIDPLGRITSAQIAIPVTTALPPPQISAPRVIFQDPPRTEDNFYDWSGLVVLAWQIDSPVEPSLLSAYRAQFAFIDPDPVLEREPYFDLRVPLDEIPVNAVDDIQPAYAEPIQRRGIYRFATPDNAPLQLRGWCYDAAIEGEISSKFQVELEDPNGQQATQTITI